MGSPVPAKNPSSLIPIFLIILIDFLGLGLVIPIFAPMFLDQNYGILSSETPYGMRTLILGLLLSAYPIATFIGSPILGGFSDRIGRKQALLISLFGTALGYFFTGYAIYHQNLLLVFISRFLTGFAGGNAGVCYATIADLSPPELRGKNFSLVSIGFSIGFTLGPFIGGKLSDSSLVDWFNYAIPFYFAGLLSLFNTFLLWVNFSETLKTKKHTRISLLTGIQRIGSAFAFPHLRFIFISIFLYSFGWYAFTQIFQVFLIERFHVNQSSIGDIYAYMGIWMVILQLVISRPVSKKLLPEKILLFSMPLVVVTLLGLLIPRSLTTLIAMIPIVVAFQGLTQPNIVALASSASDESSQGQILGISQSMQALAMAIAPMITGTLVALNPGFPIIMGGICIFFSWLVFLLYYRMQRISH